MKKKLKINKINLLCVLYNLLWRMKDKEEIEHMLRVRITLAKYTKRRIQNFKNLKFWELVTRQGQL